jgi:hypothetical protein
VYQQRYWSSSRHKLETYHFSLFGHPDKPQDEHDSVDS